MLGSLGSFFLSQFLRDKIQNTVMSLFNFITPKIDQQPEIENVENFTTKIDTGSLEGTYFPQYTSQCLYSNYGQQYYVNFNTVGSHFSRMTDEIYANEEKHSYKNEIFELIYTLYNDQPHLVHSTDPVLLKLTYFETALKICFNRFKGTARNSVNREVRRGYDIFSGCSEVLAKIDPENISEYAIFPVSKQAYDLLRYLYFIYEKYKLKAAKTCIFRVCEYLLDLETCSIEWYQQYVASAGKWESSEMNNNLKIYNDLENRLMGIYKEFIAQVEKRDTEEYDLHLPFLHVISKFESLIFILHTLSVLTHQEKPNSLIKIDPVFFGNFTAAFLHTFLGYLQMNILISCGTIKAIMERQIRIRKYPSLAFEMGKSALSTLYAGGTIVDPHNFDETHHKVSDRFNGIFLEELYAKLIEKQWIEDCQRKFHVSFNRWPTFNCLIAFCSAVEDLLDRNPRTLYSEEWVKKLIIQHCKANGTFKFDIEILICQHVVALFRDFLHFLPNLNDLANVFEYCKDYASLIESTDPFAVFDLNKPISIILAHNRTTRLEIDKLRKQIEYVNHITLILKCISGFLGVACALMIVFKILYLSPKKRVMV